MMMKKLVLGLTVGIMSVCVLAGCGSKTENTSNEVKEEDTQKDEKKSGYVLDVAGVSVGVDMDMDELVSELGEASSVFEAESCAGQGTAYIYDFGSYTIETYPSEDGKNLVGFITLKDDTISTSEGVDLSKTKDDIIECYGEEYQEQTNGLTYTKDGMKLNFILDEEQNIISIEYVSSVLG